MTDLHAAAARISLAVIDDAGLGGGDWERLHARLTQRIHDAIEGHLRERDERCDQCGKYFDGDAICLPCKTAAENAALDRAAQVARDYTCKTCRVPHDFDRDLKSEIAAAIESLKEK